MGRPRDSELFQAAIDVRGQLRALANELRRKTFRYQHRRDFALGKIHAFDMAVRKLTDLVIRDAKE